MADARITQIRVRGLRTLADVTLDLNGLTVLIGDNGSGKSSLIEACELLRRAGGENFSDELQQIHGGVGSLLRFGVAQLELGLRVDVRSSGTLEYSLAIRDDGSIDSERLGIVHLQREDQSDDEKKSPEILLERNGSAFAFRADDTSEAPVEKRIDPRRLALTSFGEFRPSGMMSTMIEVLRGIDVQLPFESTARWAQRSRGQASPLRGAVTIEPALALSRFGNNLANAFNTLKNDFSEEHWRETMDYVRLGLGYDVESVNTRADPGGGSIALRLKYAGLDQQVPAFSLSDGMLSYLCFVALFRLNTHKSVLAFDEPETHLHPELLMRVLDFLEALAAERPIVLATHSDRLLDALSDPARSVVLCELDDHRATRLVRPDAVALADWLEDYRGLGDVRSAGHARSIMTRRSGS
jgi:predicted ATPase